jgi:glyoxylase-like metal-dependent hydrolase (beta-lactamase superfamily II)
MAIGLPGWRARSPSSSLAPVLIDLQHLGRSRVIASYLLAGDEPALVDCGPTSCLAGLEAGLAGQGLGVEDLRHLLLTHIHLDHAGAAGALVRRNPELQVHVSEIGAPHLVDPSRLEASARRLYAEDFDRLWGELVPVPEENVHIVAEQVLGLDAWPTPGHASHHVSYLSGDGTCYSGDVTGVVIAPSTLIAPVCPPPDVDLEAWERSLDSIAARKPERLCLPHFGVVEEPAGHIERTRERLRAWAERVRGGASEEEFVRAVEEELGAATDPDTAAVYTQAGPLWQSYAGLVRYFAKKGEVATGQGATL